MSKEVCTGLNILKKGTDPALRPDDELPEWLWTLAETPKTLNELRRMKPDDITDEQVRRWRGSSSLGGMNEECEGMRFVPTDPLRSSVAPKRCCRRAPHMTSCPPCLSCSWRGLSSWITGTASAR